MGLAIYQEAVTKYCSGCPVRAECLEDGLGERFGMWGGATPRSRRLARSSQGDDASNSC